MTHAELCLIRDAVLGLAALSCGGSCGAVLAGFPVAARWLSEAALWAGTGFIGFALLAAVAQ